MSYVIAVVKGILRNGFHRVILVSIHGPNTLVLPLALRTIFEETGETPILLSPDYGEFYRRVGKEWPGLRGGAVAYLAVLHICGRGGEFDPAVRPGDVARTFPYESFSELRKHGVSMPYLFERPEDHVGSEPGLTAADGPRLAEIFRDVLREQVKGLPEHYEAFQEYTRKLIEDAPWSK